MILTVDKLLSESDAAKLLGGRESEVVRWLRSSGLARRHPVKKGSHYLWSEILGQCPLMSDPLPPAETAPRKRSGSLPREKL